MPLVPLIKKPGPLSAAPNAVLDNQRRPTVDRRAEIAGVGQLAESSRMPDIKGDFAAPYEALGAVGRAVTQAGNVMGGLAIKKQEAETDVQVATADLTMEDGYNNHLAWRQDKPDPATWEQNLNENLQKARGSIDANKNLHPAARDLIKIRADRFEAMSRGNLLKDSSKQTFRLAADTYDARYQRAITSKNYEEADAVAQEKVDKGYGFTHEKAAREDFITRSKVADQKEAEKEEREAVYSSNLSAIQADPYAWKAPEGMDPLLKDRLETQQRQQKGAIASDTGDFIADGIAGGAIKTEADIDAIDRPGFGPAEKAQWKKNLVATVDGRQKEFYRANAGPLSASLDARIRAWNPEDDPERVEYRAIVEEKSRLPVGFREDLNATLARKRKAAEPAPDKYVQEAGYDAIASNLTTGFFDSAPVPLIEKGDSAEVEAEKRKQIATIRNSANFKAAAVRRAWAKEMKTPKKLTPDEGQAILSRLMAAPISFDQPSLFPAGITTSPDDWKTRLQPYAGDAGDDLPTDTKTGPSLLPDFNN